jgi:hypothetical protein
VSNIFIEVHETQIDMFNQFERLALDHLANQNGGIRPAPWILELHWRDFMRFHMNRMIEHTQAWLRIHLQDIITVWRTHLNALLHQTGPGPIARVAEIEYAQQLIETFQRRLDSIEDVVRFDRMDNI